VTLSLTSFTSADSVPRLR